MIYSLSLTANTVCESALCRLDHFLEVYLLWLRKRWYSHCFPMIRFSSVLGGDFGHSARGYCILTQAKFSSSSFLCWLYKRFLVLKTVLTVTRVKLCYVASQQARWTFQLKVRTAYFRARDTFRRFHALPMDHSPLKAAGACKLS